MSNNYKNPTKVITGPKTRWSYAKGGSAYVFHADTEGLNFRKAFVDAGFHLSGCCIWVKNSLVLGRSDYQWQHIVKGI